MPEDDATLQDGGIGAAAYTEAVAVYLGLAIGRDCEYLF